MGRKLFMSLTVMLAFGLFGCIGSEKEEPATPQLVIEGNIGSGEGATVQLTLSVVAGEDAEFMEKLVKWGKVTLSDGERTEILAGGYAPDWMPPYRYFSNMMTGEPGKTYTVRAEYKGLCARSSVRMPLPTPIESIRVEPFNGNDTLRQVTLRFIAPQDCPAWYVVTIGPTGKRQQQLPSFLGTFSVSLPGQQVEVGVFNPKIFNVKPYVANLRVGQEYVVSLNRVSREVYAFRQAYQEMIGFGHNPFLTTSQALPTNIEGGLGVWSAQGTSRRLVKVE